MRVCLEWTEESYEECSEWEDHGYSACDTWDSQCCTWWPCSWGCELITWLCVAWVWVSNVVCVLWTTVTTLFCAAWQVIQVLATPAAWIVEVILAIPVIGRLIDEFLNIAEEGLWRLVGLGDAFLTLYASSAPNYSSPATQESRESEFHFMRSKVVE
jgi:hypothetical protein